jgi:hypothetical protein
VSCIIPEYAVGIRAFRALPASAFALPRCLRTCVHGAKVGAWGVGIVYWEYIYP